MTDRIEESAGKPEENEEPYRPSPYRLLTDDKHLRALVAAFEIMPVLEKLEYAAALICDRAERDDVNEPELSVAYGIITMSIEALKTVPEIEDVRLG